MKALTIFLFGLFFLAGLSDAVLAQANPKWLDREGKKPFEVEKGWTLIEANALADTWVYIAFTYKTDSVVKTAPHTFKFILKITDYDDADVDYVLSFWDVRCDRKQVRIQKAETHFKKKTDVEFFEDPTSEFEEASSFFEYATPICKKYDKP